MNSGLPDFSCVEASIASRPSTVKHKNSPLSQKKKNVIRCSIKARNSLKLKTRKELYHDIWIIKCNKSLVDCKYIAASIFLVVTITLNHCKFEQNGFQTYCPAIIKNSTRSSGSYYFAVYLSAPSFDIYISAQLNTVKTVMLDLILLLVRAVRKPLKSKVGIWGTSFMCFWQTPPRVYNFLITYESYCSYICGLNTDVHNFGSKSWVSVHNAPLNMAHDEYRVVNELMML